MSAQLEIGIGSGPPRQNEKSFPTVFIEGVNADYFQLNAERTGYALIFRFLILKNTVLKKNTSVTFYFKKTAKYCIIELNELNELRFLL